MLKKNILRFFKLFYNISKVLNEKKQNFKTLILSG